LVVERSTTDDKEILMNANPVPEPTEPTDAEMAHAEEFGSRNDAPDNVGPTDDDMPAEVVAKPEPSKPATRRPRKPTENGDPRADRAAAKKAATPAKNAAAPKAKDEWTKLSTFKEPLTHNAAHVAYRAQRTLLHGAGPEAYRKAAAKALGITDAAFEIAFYLSKATPKTEGEASK
jgi:hypothetical protein